MEFLSNLPPFIILLGVLIFIHELGHFSVAKYFGVRVEVFSIGFGKKIIKKTIGDTTYCVSIVPLGGYVKMYGDDPTADIPVDQRRFSFKDQPVWPRLAIVLAGPLMNLFLAALLFLFLAAAGDEFLKPQLGVIYPDTRAHQLGFRTGDEIKQINGQGIQKWDEVLKTIAKSQNQELSFAVNRAGQTIDVKATPSPAVNKNPLSNETVIGEIEGLTNLSPASSIGIGDEKSHAYTQGFRTGDIIRKVDGKEVDTWDEFVARLTEAQKAQAKAVQLSLQRDRNEALVDVSYTIPEGDVLGGMEMSQMYLSMAAPDSPAAKAGLQKGDKLVSISGKAITHWTQLVNIVQGHKEGEPPLEIEYLRNGKLEKVSLQPTLTTQTDAMGMKATHFAIGVANWVVFAPPMTVVLKETTLKGILSSGFENTWNVTKYTALGFVRLFQGRVSAKSLGGPLMIGKLAGDSWKSGFASFLKLMAMISINLFLLNLLPIPALDGGYVLLFSVEAIRGVPISFEKLEIIWQVGIFLLFGLMIFAMYNDIVRFLFS